MASTDGHKDESGGGADDGRHSRRLLARLSFVVILMGLGALVAVLVSNATTTRYESEAIVGLPDSLDANALVAGAAQTSFSGDEGQDLSVVADGAAIRFVGGGPTPDIAARTANLAATAFVESSDSGVTITSAATAPEDPVSPRRLRNALIGVGAGALLGSLLQPALRPRTRSAESHVPTWTTHPVEDDNAEHGDAVHGDAEHGAAGHSDSGHLDAGTQPPPRPRPRSFQAATMDEELTISWGDDEPNQEPVPEIEIPDIDVDAVSHDAVSDDAVSHDAGHDDETADDQVSEDESTDMETPAETEPAEPEPAEPEPDSTQRVMNDTEPDDSEAAESGAYEASTDGASTDEASTDEPDGHFDAPDPSPVVSRGFRDLVDRTSANLDPMIDRFAVDDANFADELHAASADTELPAEDLVAQIAFLGDEIATYQIRMDDERSRHQAEIEQLRIAHAIELDALRSEVDDAGARLVRIHEQRDSTRSQLEDRVAELEAALAAAQDGLDRAERRAAKSADRRSAAADDLAAEIEFLREEVERYQRTLDDERVTHTTAVAAARLENQDELDRIHREHRVTLNQLAQTNRNLLTAQRNEAEGIMAELESDHQRALDEAHRSYEQRLRQAREHFKTQMASADERQRQTEGSERQAELDGLHEQLDAALLELRNAKERMASLETEATAADRRAMLAQQARSQSERRQREEQRNLERRLEEQAQLLARTEKRLADERRRTNEVVRNLLEESASAASAADWARRSDGEARDLLEAEQRAEIERLRSRLRHLEDAAAQRETELEATIGDLRNPPGASPNR